MGHSKSILMHIYTENANAFHSWHTHSNSRHVPVHVFPAMTWNACMYHTHTCKKQTHSKIYSKRTSECTWVIRKFEMHCHSFQWSASKLYDIWIWSWTYNSKRNRLNGHSKSILMHSYVQWKMHMFAVFGIHILTLGMCQYMFFPATTGNMCRLTIYKYSFFNGKKKSFSRKGHHFQNK